MGSLAVVQMQFKVNEHMIIIMTCTCVHLPWITCVKPVQRPLPKEN